MTSLFGTKFNGGIFLGIAILILLLFPDLSWYSYFALIISIHQIMLLFNSIGHVIPIRYLFGSYMCLQMFIGPAFAYNGLDKYQYAYYIMKIPESQYFSYVIPVVICFIIGLHINAGRLKGEILDEEGIKRFADSNRDLPYWFIGIGFVSSFVASFFSSDLAFVMYLLGSFKFIGVFLLILGSKKFKLLELVLVYGSIVLSSLGNAMFHDLLTWLIMLGAVLAIRYKPGFNIKLALTFSFVLLSVIIQQVKGTYRQATARGEGGLETFQRAYENVNENAGFFAFRSLAVSNVRINQGFIITNIMKTVPAKVPYANGEELRLLLEAAIMPRFLAPDKLQAGDRALFTKYTGLGVRPGTSMGLSSVGDAYINYGIVGGCIFMFLLGFLYNEVLNAFHRYSKFYPVLLLFVPLVFYYPIRPDCELQTILGHLVKSSFLVYVVFLGWKSSFRFKPSVI
ncbi:MAG TPA: hypothetical protein VK483_08575 [Chitinophagaceae bacterium]|nr:hypothetical protein [Chitinophagaceae bacterium]